MLAFPPTRRNKDVTGSFLEKKKRRRKRWEEEGEEVVVVNTDLSYHEKYTHEL